MEPSASSAAVLSLCVDDVKTLQAQQQSPAPISALQQSAASTPAVEHSTAATTTAIPDTKVPAVETKTPASDSKQPVTSEQQPHATEPKRDTAKAADRSVISVEVWRKFTSKASFEYCTDDTEAVTPLKHELTLLSGVRRVRAPQLTVKAFDSEIRVAAAVTDDAGADTSKWYTVVVLGVAGTGKQIKYIVFFTDISVNMPKLFRAGFESVIEERKMVTFLAEKDVATMRTLITQAATGSTKSPRPPAKKGAKADEDHDASVSEGSDEDDGALTQRRQQPKRQKTAHFPATPASSGPRRLFTVKKEKRGSKATASKAVQQRAQETVPMEFQETPDTFQATEQPAYAPPMHARVALSALSQSAVNSRNNNARTSVTLALVQLR